MSNLIDSTTPKDAFILVLSLFYFHILWKICFHMLMIETSLLITVVVNLFGRNEISYGNKAFMSSGLLSFLFLGRNVKSS